MAKQDDFTKLTGDQFKEAIATGATIADVTALQTQGHPFDDIMEILDLQREERQAAETRQGASLASAVAGATAPDRIHENKHRHPRISVFNPQGEFHKRINPNGITRPVTVCDTRWNGVQMEGDVDSNEEIELSNAIVKPGVYRCSKNDGDKFAVTVALEYAVGDDSKPSRKLISYDYQGKSREYPSKAAIAREIIAQQAPAPEASRATA